MKPVSADTTLLTTHLALAKCYLKEAFSSKVERLGFLFVRYRAVVVRDKENIVS